MISIIIVNWNWKKWLEKCITSLLKQTYQDFEIIFVDNASTDDSIEYMKNTFQDSRIKIIKNTENSGFAWGNNIGFQNSKWKYILLLNNDTWVEESFLQNFIKAFDEIPNLWSAQSKLVLMNNQDNLDACWSFWTDLTFIYHIWIGKNKTIPLYNTAFPVFTNKGASMIIKREVIEEIWFLDDDFWCYYEETDLCHRIWIAWYECWYYPNATCYHAMWWTAITFKKSYIEFHNFKNKLLSFLKNFELSNLFKIIPIYILLCIVISFVRLFSGKLWLFLVVYKAFWWNLVNIQETLKKRKKIQKSRKKSDAEVFKITKKNPRLIYYYYLLKSPWKLKDYIDKI